jgi:hypothetical protein
MARQETAGTIINRVAVEIGLKPVSDPFSSQDEGFSQMVGLINSAGQELVELHDWEVLLMPFTQVTSNLDSGIYPLPDDYDRFAGQTGWDQSNDVPVIGPLSPQDWAYLEGRDLASDSIYVSYRIYQNQFEVYPQPPPDGVNISFSYISRNWVLPGDQVRTDTCTASGDTVLLDPLLVQKFLKFKYLTAKNLPSQAAALEFETVLQNRKGNSNGAPILSASRSRYYPYLDAFYNTSDTGYGR